MAFTTQITWEALRSIDSSTLTGSYQALGGPLVHPSYKLKLVNNSNTLVTISINGTSDIDVAPANSFWLYDEDLGDHAHEFMPAGTQIFVKGSAGTGLIYLVSQYIISN
jgi:hypothetical protein